MLENLLPAITLIIAISGIIGTTLTYRNTRNSGLSQIQKDTIEAMQRRIDSLEDEYETLKKENNRLSGVIETICSALKQKSIFLTIEGEMITIEDNRASRNVVRKSTRKPETTTGGN